MFDRHETIPVDPSAKNVRWKLRADARSTELPWRWPLPRLGDRSPSATPVAGDARLAVDIGYAGHELGNELLVPVYAVQRGEVTFACEAREGFVVSLRHERGLSSHYLHLSRMLVIPNVRRTRRLEPVEAGQVIGYAAMSPVHVRFELWERTYTQGPRAFDPRARMNEWIVSPTPDELRSTPFTHENAA